MTRRHWDRYYTPPELAETLIRVLPMHPGETALEPHAGDGALEGGHNVAFRTVTDTDICSWAHVKDAPSGWVSRSEVPA